MKYLIAVILLATGPALAQAPAKPYTFDTPAKDQAPAQLPPNTTYQLPPDSIYKLPPNTVYGGTTFNPPLKKNDPLLKPFTPEERAALRLMLQKSQQ